MSDDHFYLHTDIPAGVTIDEYRRSRPREPRIRRRVIGLGLAIRNRRSAGGKKGSGRAQFASGYGRPGTLS